MKGFELSMDLEMGFMEVFNEFVDNVAFLRVLHEELGHGPLSATEWTSENKRRLEYDVPAPQNEAFATITGGAPKVTLVERQAYSFEAATKVHVACDIAVKGAPRAEQDKLYVHAEFMLQQTRPPAKKKKAAERKQEGTPEERPDMGATKFSVKFRTSFAGALRGSVEALIQNEAYQALSVWRAMVLEAAPHKRQEAGPSQPPAEAAAAAYYPANRKDMFEISQKPYVKDPRQTAGARRVVDVPVAGGAENDGGEEFYEPDESIALADLGGSEAENHQSLLSLIVGLQRECTQLRELLLACQSRVMALELSVQDQLREDSSKKAGQAASDAAGSFRLYYKQMAELYSEMNEIEERREREWESKMELLAQHLPSSPRASTSPRAAPAAAKRPPQKATAGKEGRQASAYAPVRRDSSALTALKWTAAGAAAAGCGFLLASLLKSKFSSGAQAGGQ